MLIHIYAYLVRDLRVRFYCRSDSVLVDEVFDELL